MLSIKQGGIKYHFKSLWYDATWDWTQVSRTISEHSIHLANKPIVKKHKIYTLYSISFKKEKSTHN